MSDARTVVVTGASRGLGRGIALRLRGAGYRVVAVSRQPDGMDAEGLHPVACDLAQTAGLADLARRLRREFGPIYGLVNNAGIGTAGVLANMPDDEVARLATLNLVSPMLLTKHLLRSMLARGEGRIVNVASIVAFTGYSGLAAYSATKAGLIGFTRSLAREVGRAGVNVNAIAPGFIDTELTQSMDEDERERVVRRSALQRLAGVEDVAAAAEYLLGEGGRNLTGTVLTVDAGNTA
jgi:3-oxoacyl-[acyl-carrier protein] reductase